MKQYMKEIRPAMLITAFLLILGIAGAVHNLLYNGATPESRRRLAMRSLNEETVQFLEERSIADGGFILWLYEENGQKGVATFTQTKEDGYYFSGYRLNDGGQPSHLNLYDMDHGSYDILLFDRDDLAYLEYEVYANDILWKAEKIPAEPLMILEMPESNSVRATFTYYDTAGNRY